MNNHETIAPIKTATRLPSILFILHSHICGGAEKHTLTLMRGLHDQGYRVAFCGPADSWLADEAKAAGITCFHVPLNGFYDIYSLFLIVSIVLSFKADILHGHMTRGALYAGLAAKLTGRPSVSTAHLMDSHKRFGLTNKIIAVCDSVRVSLLSKGLPSEKIVVIYNGIIMPTPRIGTRRSIRKSLGIKENHTALCMLSFPLKFKGHDLAIEALAMLNNPKYRLILIGRTEGVHYVRELKKKAAEAGVEKQITFLGHRDNADDVYALLCGMDIFLMPSRCEAFPLSIIEACACGLPVIASKVGGVPELISHEKTGLLFTMGDSAALAESIQRLDNDKKLRDQLAKQGQDNVQKRFSITNMLAPTIDLYHSLVNPNDYRQATITPPAQSIDSTLSPRM